MLFYRTNQRVLSHDQAAANDLADKQAMPARGEPWIVHPREVAKLPEFQGTDPEIILACILEAGILDTADIRASIHHSDVLSGSESCTGFSVCEAKPLAGFARSARLDRSPRSRQGSPHRR
jgi:hypothetical protein